MKNTNYLVLFAVISFSNIFYANAFPWTPCKDIKTFATLKDFNVHDCHTDACRYQSGDNVTFRVDFIPSVNSSALIVLIQTRVFGVERGFPDLEPNACKSNGVNCPLTVGSLVTYQVSLNVPDFSDEVTT
uniref:Ecdysteroid-regulated 16 kDa protein (Trinotate prediction) n=1 Tax=Myxobolus squamalis TaxID=59785 RepID=A0A6B2G1C3_MYXSQ